jgi:hypothetical protein
MADGGLLLIFRGMTTEDLLDARDTLTQQMLALGPYASQAVGTKNWTKDTRGMQSQLEAIQFVLNERSTPGGYAGYMITDFSKVDSGTQGQPAGTTDQLSY